MSIEAIIGIVVVFFGITLVLGIIKRLVKLALFSALVLGLVVLAQSGALASIL